MTKTNKEGKRLKCLAKDSDHSLEDCTQWNRKLKHPQIRAWFHPKKGGDSFYYTYNTTKNSLTASLTAKPRDESDAYAEDSYLIAYNGREYNPKNFKEIYSGFF